MAAVTAITVWRVARTPPGRVSHLRPSLRARSRRSDPQQHIKCRGGHAMFKKILLGLAALVVVFLIVVAMQPNEFRVARTVGCRRAAGTGVRAGERLPQLGGLVAVGEARSQRQGDVRGAAFGSRRGLHLGRQRRGRRRPHDSDREPPERPDSDQARLREADGRNQRRRIHLQAARAIEPPSPGP